MIRAKGSKTSIVDVLELGLADRPLRERYDRLFEACPRAFIQQSTYWAEAIADLGPDIPLFLLCEQDGVDIAGMPLYLYEHDLGNLLTSVPQAGPLGGVFVRDGLSASAAEEAYAVLLKRALRIAVDHRCITMTVITNPFWPDLHLYSRYLEPDFVFENFTQYIDLTQVVADGKILLKDYNRRSNLSRSLSKARAARFSIQHGATDAEFHAWYDLHARRHRELDVPPLSLRLFENLRRVLEPRNNASLLLANNKTQPVAGCFFVYHGHVLDVFMLSMDNAYRDRSPNYLITEYSLRWADRLGVQVYNWQSSPGRSSGVYSYKKQWGSEEAMYYFVTRLLCEPERIQRIGLDALKKAYAGHFVVPYGAFDVGFGQSAFKRE